MQKLSKTMMQGITNTNIEIYPKLKVENNQKNKDIFIKLINRSAVRVMNKLGKNFEFKIDDQNSEIVDQLWLYTLGDSMFKGNLQKGIFLSGNIGTGKTFLLLTYVDFLGIVSRKNYTILFPDTIHADYQSKGLDFYRKRPLFIDDIAREQKKVHYGNVIDPVREITMIRNRFPTQNFATANFQIFAEGKVKRDNELIKRYGAMIFDRMREMYNFLELKGKSRRG